MVVGTVSFATFASLGNSTLRRLVNKRVVFQFFPTMALTTPVFLSAAILIGPSVLLSLPALALRVRVFKGVGSTAVVLPVVSIHAQVALMLFVRVGTPHRLEVEHVEIGVPIHLIEDVDAKFGFMVCEGTNATVLTLPNLVWVGRAKLCFVLLRVVEVFHSVVAPDALIALLALFF